MSKNILIVEDEAIIAAELEIILTSLGHNVVAKTGNGDRALDLLKNKDLDLALLDISIKGTLDGIDLAKIIRKKYKFPFIFLTSYADLRTLDQVKKTLPYGYIVKPFTENDIRSTVELALYKRESEETGGFPSQAMLEVKLETKFTTREYDMYYHLFQGKTNKEIAEANYISVNTVKLHLKNLFLKLDVHSRSHAMRLVLED